jgi:hypothetical protein
MKKSRSKFLKIVDEKHDINFHWPKPTLINNALIHVRNIITALLHSYIQGVS